jgi:LPXTG-motif cell wall-anchored protein
VRVVITRVIAIPVGVGSRHSTSSPTPLTAHTVTGRAGQYRFSHLPPGHYRVTASVDSAGIRYTSDTDGLRDWIVAVNVTSGNIAVARFAGLGKGTLDGNVFANSNGVAISDATVQCRWAGFDDVLGTADDVVINLVADVDGQFHVAHVPFGLFSCVGHDPATGANSAATGLWVLSIVPVHAHLPVATPHLPAAPAPQQPATTDLANTGPPTRQLLTLAIGLLLAGLGALHFGRRRRV